MADFFGKWRQVNGTFARSAQAEALKKRFLSSDALKIGNHHVRPRSPSRGKSRRTRDRFEPEWLNHCRLILCPCGRFLRAARFGSAESQRGGCIDAAAGDRFFRASAGFRARL